MTILHRLFAAPPRAALLAGAFALAAPIALTLPAAPAAAQQASQLDRVVNAVRGITTMRADFTQTDRAGNSVAGELTLKSPGRIRFEYERGVNLLVVSNGSSLTFVDYDVQQEQRWPISNSPLGALLDPQRDLKRYGRLVPTANPDVVSVEVKDSSKPEYGTITLVFVESPQAPGGLQLVSWVALDAQNQRTTVRLSNQRYGMEVPNSTFNYRPARQTTRRPR